MDNKRANNFSTEEEVILVNLVEKYKHIIENKKSGATTWAEKEKTWKRIEEEFNSSGNTFRSFKHLKEKYANLKKKTKQKFAANKLNTLKTGGGCHIPMPITNVDNRIKLLLGEQIDGLKNSYDCDSITPVIPLIPNEVIVQESTPENCTDNSDVEREPEIIDTQLVSENNLDDEMNDENFLNNWSKYSSKDLTAPVSTKLKVNPKSKNIQKNKKEVIQRANITKRYVPLNYEVMKAKLDFINLQKEKFMEEHTLRMEILNMKKRIAERKLEKK